jgi:predicted AlkP superfamily pyrophosphatase or phosphodiesterase
MLSIPGLREKDVAVMPRLRELMAGGQIVDLVPSFPCVTCPVQANMTTGRLPVDHGVVANGIYWPRRQEVEMWTAPNDCIERPQIWDLLSQHDESLTSAVWFPMHAKGCEADYVCTPAPIHNPDGSESLWCYTRPQELYGVLRDRLGHFPLQHFWGPMADIRSSAWIVDSAVYAAETYRPHFCYIYLPHLDYAAQRSGPESAAADGAVAELDEQIGRLVDGLGGAYDDEQINDMLWLVIGEYVITRVRHVLFPNRVLREAGLLAVEQRDDGEHLDIAGSRAWAMTDHQLSHVYLSDDDEAEVQRLAAMFREQPGVDEVLAGEGLAKYGLNHQRSGQLVLVSEPESWQAYYWWLDEDRAPSFARTVDIHRKPGYDPVELHVDPATKSIPLDATLVKGSHGAPARDRSQQSVALASHAGVFSGTEAADVDVFGVVLRHFGLQAD